LTIFHITIISSDSSSISNGKVLPGSAGAGGGGVGAAAALGDVS